MSFIWPTTGETWTVEIKDNTLPTALPTVNPLARCTCSVLCIYIPPGQYIDIVCPVHGRSRMYGSTVTCQ